jgi:hypothetical protein
MADDTPFGFAKPLAIQLRNLARQQGQSGGGARTRPENRRVAIALTPVAGIPARAGAVVGTAECTFFQIDDTFTLVSTSVAEVVCNLSGIAVAGSVYITCNREYISGKWIVTMESCEPA